MSGRLPTGEMRNAHVQFISLVDKAANKRKFTIFKSANAPEPDGGDGEGDRQVVEQARGLLATLKAFFVGGGVTKEQEEREEATFAKAGIQVSKAESEAVPSFAASIAARDTKRALGDATWILEDVIAGILASEAENKAGLVAQAIDEFRAYVLGRIGQIGVQKALEELGAVQAAEVQKAGRKMAAARLEKLRRASALLAEILTEVEDDTGEEQDGRGEAEVTKAELEQAISAAVAKAVEPLEARIKALEDEGKAEAEAEVKKAGEPSVEEIVRAAVEKAVAPLAERLEVLERARGLGNALPTGEVKKYRDAGDSVWGGIFL